ncbi:MAG: hypothetical protein ACHQM4_10280 [Thermoanaerobaculia bacterium]
MSFQGRHGGAEWAGEPDPDFHDHSGDLPLAAGHSLRLDADADRRFHRNAAHRDADVRTRLDACDVHADGGSPDADAGNRHPDRDARSAEPDGDAVRGHADPDTVRRNSDAHAGSPDADAGSGHADRDSGNPDTDALCGHAHTDAVRRRSDAHTGLRGLRGLTQLLARLSHARAKHAAR